MGNCCLNAKNKNTHYENRSHQVFERALILKSISFTNFHNKKEITESPDYLFDVEAKSTIDNLVNATVVEVVWLKAQICSIFINNSIFRPFHSHHKWGCAAASILIFHHSTIFEDKSACRISIQIWKRFS